MIDGVNVIDGVTDGEPFLVTDGVMDGVIDGVTEGEVGRDEDGVTVGVTLPPVWVYP